MGKRIYAPALRLGWRKSEGRNTGGTRGARARRAESAANPVANRAPSVLSAVAEEFAAAERSGFSGADPARAFVEPQHLSYPFAYERIAQLFDSPNAPDLIVNPKSYAFGPQPRHHAALDVVQSRAPLVFSGPGVKPGESDAAVRNIDIAPTI